MQFKTLIVAAALAFTSSVAYADTFSFNLSGGTGSFSGSGTLTATTSGSSGGFLVTGIVGTGITGVISPGGYDGNDNLIFPSATTFVDAAGFAFTDQNGPDTFRVDVHSVGTSYFATLTDEDNATLTVPVSLSVTAATPEPSSVALLGTGLLGLAGVMKRRFA